MKKKVNEHPRAIASRARKEAAEREQAAAALKKAEDAYYHDEGTTAKERRAKEREEKNLQKAEAKAKKKALLEAEEEMVAQLRLSSKAKQELRRLGELPRKVTQYESTQIKLSEQEERERQYQAKKMAEAKIFNTDPLAFENRNRELDQAIAEDEAVYGAGNVVHASNINAAISSFSNITGADLRVMPTKMVEKRAKAAYKKYEADRLPEMRAMYPDLKLSQLKERVYEEWKKSPENPANQ